ncbi:MAG TPA: MFS transporter [Bryobacteraceae bacterium]|nr:MFS transporter [Bryobacteraceae bacterium]
MSTSASPAAGRVAFRYPSFRYLVSARFLAAASSEMQAVGVAWQIYGMTGRPLDLGLVGLAQFLPGIFLFLIVGHVIDRFPRRTIVIISSAAFAGCSLALLALTVHGLRTVWPVYAVLLLNGVVRAFHTPAHQALVPQIVPQEHFPNAVSWGSSIFQTAMFVGPTIGGLLYGMTGSPLPVYACAASAYVAALALLTAVKVAAPPRAKKAVSMAVVLEGMRYLRRNSLLLGATSLDLFAVLLGGAVALLPVYASDILHVGARGLGVLRAAPGVGAVLTALFIAHHPLRRRVGAIMLWCVCGFGLMTVVFGLSRNVALSLGALVLVGACDMVSVIVRHTLIQMRTPDEMRGRVSAVNMVFLSASNEVGQFESGITAQWMGTVPAVVAGGVGTILVVLLWSRLFPALRKAEQLTQE